VELTAQVETETEESRRQNFLNVRVSIPVIEKEEEDIYLSAIATAKATSFFYLSFDFGSFLVLLALICAIYGLFTPKVEVSGKEGKIPLSCSVR